eukprot:TRINITY_DN20991_c0_g1_i2.p2 TRINITY_DN20991_c0_g1~~TRINITY_DN20991_c0_g1_i2.p2  ORF type:complete len:267 (+),score=73.94 TRINITY_DN20991_c0_g1_i2:1393-2193(+)
MQLAGKTKAEVDPVLLAAYDCLDEDSRKKFKQHRDSVEDACIADLANSFTAKWSGNRKGGKHQNKTPPEFRDLVPGKGALPGVYISLNDKANLGVIRGFYRGGHPRGSRVRVFGPEHRSMKQALTSVAAWMNMQHECVVNKREFNEVWTTGFIAHWRGQCSEVMETVGAEIEAKVAKFAKTTTGKAALSTKDLEEGLEKEHEAEQSEQEGEDAVEPSSSTGPAVAKTKGGKKKGAAKAKPKETGKCKPAAGASGGDLAPPKKKAKT